MMSARVIRHIETAACIARKIQNDSTFFLCAILAKGNRSISMGYNKPYRTSPASNNPYNTIHAEMDALCGVPSELLRKSTLYVSRVGYNYRAELMIAKPCHWCQLMIRHSGIRHVYYTINNHTVGYWDVQSDKHTEIQVCD